MKGNTKIKRTFMRDEAYTILQDWIITGRLKQNEQLRDKELSNLLGISRTPIRESLLRLESDGLVITQANRWTLVAPINLEEAEDIYSIVKVLESLAVEQGINNCTAKDVQKLELINEKFRCYLEEGDKISAFQADTEFHNHIVKLSTNHELSKLLNVLKIKIQRMEIHYFSIINSSVKSYKEHKNIIKALAEKNKDEALKAINLNWENSLYRIQKNNNK